MFEAVSKGKLAQLFAVLRGEDRRWLLAEVELPGACIVDPRPWRGDSRRYNDGSPRSFPDGAWLRCGLESTQSVGVAAVPGGLRINDEVVLFPEGTSFELPSAPPRFEPPCPADARAKTWTARVAVKPGVDESEKGLRLVVLRVPEARQELRMALLSRERCTPAISKRWGWHHLDCGSGRRKSYSVQSYVADGKLIVASHLHVIDFSEDILSVMALPCGTSVRFEGGLIQDAGPTSCEGRCQDQQDACDARCLQEHGDQNAEVGEKGTGCSNACSERRDECDVRCFKNSPLGRGSP